jgi:hypothetical protein
MDVESSTLIGFYLASGCRPSLPAGQHRVLAFREDGFGGPALFSGSSDPQCRVGSEREQLLLACKAVLHPPKLRAVRLDEQKQTFAVG